MAKFQYKYYSVYDRKTDLPVIIHGTTSECVKATGVTQATFYTYVTRTRNGMKRGKYEIYEDEDDE